MTPSGCRTVRLQNTATNLGAAIGTALAGSLLITALTTSFLQGVQANPAIPEQVKSQATVQLTGGVPFLSDIALQDALTQAGVDPAVTQAALTTTGRPGSMGSDQLCPCSR